MTINDGKLGIKPIGPEVSIDKLSDDSHVHKNGIRKELESEDKLGNFEIQDLLGDKEIKPLIKANLFMSFISELIGYQGEGILCVAIIRI